MPDLHLHFGRVPSLDTILIIRRLAGETLSFPAACHILRHVRTMRTGESELKMNYAEMNAKLLSQSGIYKSPTRGSCRLFTWGT